MFYIGIQREEFQDGIQDLRNTMSVTADGNGIFSHGFYREVMPGDDVETPIWDTYKEIVSKHDERGEKAIGNIERFAFYDEAKTAYCIISTSEKALYANVMLQKGVVINND